MPQRHSQIVSPASSTPPLRTKRGGSTDAQDGGSSNTTSTTSTNFAGFSDKKSLRMTLAKGSPKNRRTHEDINNSPEMQATATRTLDSWFLRGAPNPAPGRSGRSRSPLRSLSPDAPVIGKSARVFDVGRVPPTQVGRKGRIVELSNSPSPSPSLRGHVSGSVTVVTVTPPGSKSPRSSVVCPRSHVAVSATPPPSNNDSSSRLARRARRLSAAASSEQGSTSALTEALGSSSSRHQRQRRSSGLSAKTKIMPAKGIKTFTRRSVKAKSANKNSASSKTPEKPVKSLSQASFSCLPALRQEDPEPRNEHHPTTFTPVAASAPPTPSASYAAGQASHVRVIKDPNCTGEISSPPSAGVSIARIPLTLNPCPAATHVAKNSEAFPITTVVSSVTTGEVMRLTGSAPSSKRPALLRAPTSKSTAPKKRKAVSRPTFSNSGPLIVGTGGGGGWKKGAGDFLERGGGKWGVKITEQPFSADASSEASEVCRKKAPLLKKSGVQVSEICQTVRKLVVADGAAAAAAEDGGIFEQEEQRLTPPKKRKAATSLGKEGHGEPATKRGRDCSAADGKDAGKGVEGACFTPAVAGDPTKQKASPLGTGARTAAGTVDSTNAHPSPAATAAVKATPNSATVSQATSAAPVSVTPSRPVALPATGDFNTTPSTGRKQGPSERLLSKPVAAATGGLGWTPVGAFAGDSAATTLNEMSQPEGDMETHVMGGDGVHMKCRHCKSRLARGGCSTGSCVDCCFKAAVPCVAHAKQLERKRLEQELLAAGPSREERRRLAKGVFKEEAIHAIRETATVWCFVDFLCARSNQGAFTALSRTQRAATGRRPRLLGRRTATETRDSAAGPAGKAAADVLVLSGKNSRVRPSLARWRRKSSQMLAAVASGSLPTPLSY